MILSKSSKEESREAIIKHQYLAPDSGKKKKKNGNKSDCIFYSDSIWCSEDHGLVVQGDFKCILTKFLNETTCHGIDKLFANLYQHYWRNFK